jgi:hypothetical protein
LSSACPIAPQPTIPIDFNGMIANAPGLNRLRRIGSGIFGSY